MTHFPDYLKSYPNMNTALPMHLSINRLVRGYRAHRHDFLELSFVIEGTGSESINGVRHRMAPGTFTFVLPYQIHELFTDPGNTMVLYNCMFSMELLMGDREQGELEHLLADAEHLKPFVHFDREGSNGMRQLFDAMHREYTGNERWRTTMLLGKLKEALVRFDRERIRSASGDLPIAHPIKPERSVWRLIRFIHGHYREELSLTQLSDVFGLSVSRISELIKQTTGQSFVYFVDDLRMRHAGSLLVSTDMTVAEIAHEVGYGSYKTFSRKFRSLKGLAPLQYRKKGWTAARNGMESG